MMNTNRRALLVGASLAATLGLMAAAGCATTSGGGVSFATVQAYVADVDATLDKLVPLVASLDPSLGAQLQKLQADADAAANAFGGLTSPASGATTAQQVLTAISDAFTLISAVPGLPPEYAAAIAAAQLLLVVLGNFFSVAPAPTTEVARAHAGVAAGLWGSALATYQAAQDKAALAAEAQAQVKAWLAAH
jgi:hypothetical protein